MMHPTEDKKKNEILKSISHERDRTNILKNQEQRTIAFLVQRIPGWVSSDMLTGIGFVGNLIVFSSFLLATLFGRVYLLTGLLGFIISWFGDSLDGRIAYYRRKPRKWYGFSLDLTIDWMGTFLIGLGFIIYADNTTEILGFLFVVLYGWEIITTLMRYKITGTYSIDSGVLGPTEVRILISFILVLEVLFESSIIYLSALACLVLLILNLTDFLKLLKLADLRDREDSEKSAAQ